MGNPIVLRPDLAGRDGKAARLSGPSGLLLLSAVMLLAVGAARGQAAVPDSSGAVHACVDNVSGKIRVLDSGKGQSCKQSETAITWTNSSATSVGMTWQGAWLATKSYDTDNVVSYNGGSYVALAASTGISPAPSKLSSIAATYRSWAFLGGVGPAGPAGPAGPTSGAPATAGSGAPVFITTSPLQASGDLYHLDLPPGRYFLLATFNMQDNDSSEQNASCRLNVGYTTDTATLDALSERLHPAESGGTVQYPTEFIMQGVVYLTQNGYAHIICSGFKVQLQTETGVFSATQIASITTQ